MRYIDSLIVEEKSKKIEWNNALRIKYTHLNHLVYNENGNDYIEWNKIEKFHLNALETISIEERKIYIKKYSDWNILKSTFIKEFGNKCWYSEAPLDNGVIDHFRPKNKAINYCLDETDNNHKKIFKLNGYWRLAYNLQNFRLSSNTSNLRFTDMESDEAVIGGKSIYFPLKCEDGSFSIADDYDIDPDITERSLLLDPIKQSDSGIISYDKDGEPIVFGYTATQILKANVSINLYNLRNTLNFINKRQELWNYIERVIKETAKYTNNNNITDEERQIKEDDCFSIIRKCTDKKECFSSVALACYKTHRINPDYQFLNHFNP
jgi:hypothetical protein